MDKDSHLINETLDNRNKWRGPGSPGVQLAKGYILQALDLINDEDVHLCADSDALKEALHSLEQAHRALSHNKEDVPHDS
tara:strand:- start:866 stop:1105 length:240 start_codon:yes stop_codon:yes gene_type:complete